jgi:pimeloyl-ACP methyl ester carboxylesterase
VIWLALILGGIGAYPFLRERARRPMNDVVRGAAPGCFAELPRGVTHYRWIGPADGSVAVCVHGLTSPSIVWEALARGLARRGYRVLTYDLYGRGFSDRPRGRQDAAFFTSQLEQLLQHQKVRGSITLLGYSMGGAIATRFAAAHPGRIAQLVLIAPAGMGLARGRLLRFIVETPVLGDWLMLALYPGRLRKGLKAERRRPDYREEVATAQGAELNRRGFVPAVLSSLRGILAETQEAAHRLLHESGIPILAIWGAQDDVIPSSAIGTLALWSRDARHAVVEGAGHGLTYTHAEEILTILQDELPPH